MRHVICFLNHYHIIDFGRYIYNMDTASSIHNRTQLMLSNPSSLSGRDSDVTTDAEDEPQSKESSL